MKRIDIKELWHDHETGQFCAEIDMDGRRVASVYSPYIEALVVNALAGLHSCEVWRRHRTQPASRVR